MTLSSAKMIILYCYAIIVSSVIGISNVTLQVSGAVVEVKLKNADGKILIGVNDKKQVICGIPGQPLAQYK